MFQPHHETWIRLTDATIAVKAALQAACPQDDVATIAAKALLVVPHFYCAAVPTPVPEHNHEKQTVVRHRVHSDDSAVSVDFLEFPAIPPFPFAETGSIPAASHEPLELPAVALELPGAEPSAHVADINLPLISWELPAEVLELPEALKELPSKDSLSSPTSVELPAVVLELPAALSEVPVIAPIISRFPLELPAAMLELPEASTVVLATTYKSSHAPLELPADALESPSIVESSHPYLYIYIYIYYYFALAMWAHDILVQLQMAVF